jgi:hypothetical protein
MDNFLLQPGVFSGFIIGVFSSLVATFIGMGIIRYWGYRRVKSIERRIKEIESRKKTIDDLATSDRSLILLSLLILFLMIMIGSLAFGIYLFTFIQYKNTKFGNDVLSVAMIFIFFVSAFYIKILIMVDKHQVSIESFNKNLASLKEKLSRLIK